MRLIKIESKKKTNLINCDHIVEVVLRDIKDWGKELIITFSTGKTSVFNGEDADAVYRLLTADHREVK